MTGIAKLLTRDGFSREVELLVMGGMTWLEAAAHYCEVNELDYDSVAKIVGSDIKGHLEEEGVSLSLIKKQQGVIDETVL